MSAPAEALLSCLVSFECRMRWLCSDIQGYGQSSSNSARTSCNESRLPMEAKEGVEIVGRRIVSHSGLCFL